MMDAFADITASIAVAAYRIRAWRSRRKNLRQPPSSQFSASAMEKGYSEKQLGFGETNWITAASYAQPHQPVLVPILPKDPAVRWQPQIRSVSSPEFPPALPADSGLVTPPAPVKQIAITRYTHKHDASSSSMKNPFTDSASKEEHVTPPPIYRTLPPPPPPPEADLPSVPPPTPPANSAKHKRSNSRATTLTHISVPPTSFDIPPIPATETETPEATSANRRDSLTPSSRDRDSHGRRQPSTPSFSAILAAESHLPRLMIVASTFTPARDDEILVKSGETLRLLEEYADGWCSVQRVGRPDAEKGMMPRFCLQERPKVLSPPRLLSTFSFHGARQK